MGAFFPVYFFTIIFFIFLTDFAVHQTGLTANIMCHKGGFGFLRMLVIVLDVVHFHSLLNIHTHTHQVNAVSTLIVLIYNRIICICT